VKNREDLGPKGRLQSFPNVGNKRIQGVLFIGWQGAFERSKCVRTYRLFAFDRTPRVRPRITAVAARAD
jgi:hypothetical protein